MFDRILAAVDGSETAKHGFAVAVAFALERHAILDVLYVVDETSALQNLAYTYAYALPDVVKGLDASMREAGDRVLADCETYAAKKGVQIHSIIEKAVGEPVASAILRIAGKQKSNLIVLGTHGRRGLDRLTMGSDAESVVRQANVPVLLVRGPMARGTGKEGAAAS